MGIAYCTGKGDLIHTMCLHSQFSSETDSVANSDVSISKNPQWDTTAILLYGHDAIICMNVLALFG